MTRKSPLFLLPVAAALTFALGCPNGEGPVEEPQCTADADCEIGKVCEDGSCVEIPCPDVYDPVCGEDGQTYSNECEARVAHVAVAHSGECEQVCGGIQGLPCDQGQVCDLPPGMCQGADLQGVCVERPEVCPEIFDPVCACDGTTYSNDCFRLMAGAQKDHDGECGYTEES